jgi:hypothetical protein
MKNKESLRPTHPGSPIHGASHVRRQGLQLEIPTDRATAAAKGLAQRAPDPAG